jgi:hypothetical protein
MLWLNEIVECALLSLVRDMPKGLAVLVAAFLRPPSEFRGEIIHEVCARASEEWRSASVIWTRDALLAHPNPGGLPRTDGFKSYPIHSAQLPAARLVPDATFMVTADGKRAWRFMNGALSLFRFFDGRVYYEDIFTFSQRWSAVWLDVLTEQLLALNVDGTALSEIICVPDRRLLQLPELPCAITTVGVLIAGTLYTVSSYGGSLHRREILAIRSGETYVIPHTKDEGGCIYTLYHIGVQLPNLKTARVTIWYETYPGVGLRFMEFLVDRTTGLPVNAKTTGAEFFSITTPPSTVIGLSTLILPKPLESRLMPETIISRLCTRFPWFMNCPHVLINGQSPLAFGGSNGGDLVFAI